MMEKCTVDAWGMNCAALRKPPVAKPRFAAPKKPAVKSGGLGVKKMTTKVDDSLFEQAPMDDPPPAAALSALSPSLSVSQCLTEVPAMLLGP
jgi:hypothetical protein